MKLNNRRKSRNSISQEIAHMRMDNPHEERDAIREGTEYREFEKQTLKYFVDDIIPSIKSTCDLDPHFGYNSENEIFLRERGIYLKELLEKSIKHLPIEFREDASFFIRFLRENKHIFYAGDEKSFFDSIPVSVRTSSDFLDAFVKFYGSGSWKIFLDLSDDIQDVISKDWFQKYWEKDVKNGSLFDLEEVSIDRYPFRLLSSTQIKILFDMSYLNGEIDFMNIPHKIRDGYKWHQDYENKFNDSIRYMNYEEREVDYDEIVSDLTALSNWPEIYRKGLEYKKQDIISAIIASDFNASLINTINVQTGNDIESLDLYDKMINSVDNNIRNSGVVKNDLFKYFSEQDQKKYKSFFYFIQGSNFLLEEITMAFVIWKKKKIEGTISKDDIKSIRHSVLRRVYSKDREKNEVVKMIDSEYNKFAGDAYDASDLFWKYLGNVDRVDSFSSLLNFIKIINKNPQIDGFVVFRSIIESIENEYDSEMVMKYFDLVDDTEVEHLLEKNIIFDIHILYNNLFSRKFSEQHSLDELIELKDFDFQEEMKVLKEMRNKKHELNKEMDLGHSTIDKIIKEHIGRIREMQKLELEILSEIPDLIRNFSEDKSNIILDELINSIDNSLSKLSKHTRITTELKIAEYVKKYNLVREISNKYIDKPCELMELTIPHSLLSGSLDSTGIKVLTRGISLVFVLTEKLYNTTFNSSREVTHHTSGILFFMSRIRELNGSIVVARNTTGLYGTLSLERTILHESRHAEDRILFKQEASIDRAKTEILAYITEGRKIDLIKDILTNKDGLYFYSDLENKKKWKEHCRRVREAIDIAVQVGDLDKLAITPIAQWRKLLPHPSVV